MQRSREYLYGRFKNNQKPNGDDFKDLIDSSFNVLDDKVNAGWYFFHFLPHPYYGENGLFASSRLEKYPEFMSSGSETIAQYLSGVSLLAITGYMNIPLPKGISRVKGFRLIGSMDINDLRLGSLFLNPTLRRSSIDSPGVSFSLPTITKNRTGIQEFDEPSPSSAIPEIFINPNEDTLLLIINAFPGDPRNKIILEKFGIQFT